MPEMNGTGPRVQGAGRGQGTNRSNQGIGRGQGGGRGDCVNPDEPRRQNPNRPANCPRPTGRGQGRNIDVNG